MTQAVTLVFAHIDHSSQFIFCPLVVDAVVTSISRAPPVAAATGAYDREESESDDDDEYAIEI